MSYLSAEESGVQAIVNAAAGSGLSYGADQQQVTASTADGPTTILFRRKGVTLKTRTITYTAGVITNIVDT